MRFSLKLMLIVQIFAANLVISFAEKSDEISAKKCREYYNQNDSKQDQTKSTPREFPHMARLGFLSPDNETKWYCGGSLISLQHVLTSAHCAHSRFEGLVKYVRLGDLNVTQGTSTDPPEVQKFTVSKTTLHPNYTRMTAKYDIAIVQLDRKIVLTDFVKPACLFQSKNLGDNADLTSTGWGRTSFGGEPSESLKKVKMELVNITECRKQYSKYGVRGDISEELQVCAKPSSPSKEFICQGDGGGPLQVVDHSGGKHHNILGIVSFGKACGIQDSADVFTRVYAFIPWIESIVWG